VRPLRQDGLRWLRGPGESSDVCFLQVVEIEAKDEA